MATDDLKKKSDKELLKELQTARKDLREFRFGMAGSQTRDSKKGRELRKTIARILTQLGTRTQ